MIFTRTLWLSILISAFAGAATGPAMAQACTRQGVDVTCDDGRRGIFAGERHHLGRWHAIEAGLAASQRHHRQQIVRRHRPRRIRRLGVWEGHGADGKSERTEQGALPDPGWRIVLFLIPDAFSSREPAPTSLENASLETRWLVVPRSTVGDGA